jgi:hypothetical protein
MKQAYACEKDLPRTDRHTIFSAGDSGQWQHQYQLQIKMVSSGLATISAVLGASIAEVLASSLQFSLHQFKGKATQVRSKPTDEAICSGRTGFSGYVDTGSSPVLGFS